MVIILVQKNTSQRAYYTVFVFCVLISSAAYNSFRTGSISYNYWFPKKNINSHYMVNAVCLINKNTSPEVNVIIYHFYSNYPQVSTYQRCFLCLRQLVCSPVPPVGLFSFGLSDSYDIPGCIDMGKQPSELLYSVFWLEQENKYPPQEPPDTCLLKYRSK